MAAPQNHWKLGLFVVVGLALALAAVAILGARSMHEDVRHYVSFFDESVQGLEVGSPIKFRGVTIGTVSRIQVAPDHRHVEVQSALGLGELTRLGLDIGEKPAKEGAIPKLVMAVDLRLQLASSGLTGVKFLQLDFFDLTAYPRPELPFPTPKHYIPTAPSLMKNLEASIDRMMNSLPEITEKTSAILGEIGVVVRDLDDRQIPDRIAATLEKVDSLLATAEQRLDQVDTAGLSRHAKRTLAGVTSAVGRLDGILARIDSDRGLLTSVERAGAAIGDALRNADGLGGRILDTLATVQASARSLRKLTEALEQDPDMLLKGRSPERPR